MGRRGACLDLRGVSQRTLSFCLTDWAFLLRRTCTQLWLGRRDIGSLPTSKEVQSPLLQDTGGGPTGVCVFGGGTVPGDQRDNKGVILVPLCPLPVFHSPSCPFLCICALFQCRFLPHLILSSRERRIAKHCTSNTEHGNKMTSHRGRSTLTSVTVHNTAHHSVALATQGSSDFPAKKQIQTPFRLTSK